MKIPQSLISAYGTPRISENGWCIWRIGNDWYTDEVVLWRPGMARAARKRGDQTVERIPVSEADFFHHSVTDNAALSSRGQAMVAEAQMWETPLGAHMEYLLERGLDHEEIYSHWVMNLQDYPDYVIAPIYEDGTLVSWHGRAIHDDVERRYRTPSKTTGWMPTTRTLWGLDRIAPGVVIYVCQGIFDAYYFSTGVAQMHARVTREQAVKVLDRKPSAIVVVADNGDENIGETDPVIEAADMFKSLTGREVSVLRPANKYKDYGILVALGRRMP